LVLKAFVLTFWFSSELVKKFFIYIAFFMFFDDVVPL